MPCLPEPSVAERAELWRTAPAMLQQVRRCHLEACGGRRAKRALFGQPDREETRRFVKEELAAMRAADQQKYNFDFSTMQPLAGPFEWQPVAAGEVPAAYQLGRLQSGIQQHRSARRLDFDAPRPITPPEASRCGAASSTEASSAAPTREEPTAAAEQRRPASPPTPEPSSTSSPSLAEALARRTSPPATRRPASIGSTGSRQASITDFMKSRKRPSAFSSCGGDTAAKRSSGMSTAAGDGGSSPPAAPAAAPAGGADSA